MSIYTTPTTDDQLNSESDANYTYYAFAPPGTPLNKQGWKVFRVSKAEPTVKMFADGNANFDNVGSGLAALNYSWS